MSSWFSVVVSLFGLISLLLFLYFNFAITIAFFLSKFLVDLVLIFNIKSLQFLLAILLISICVFFWSWYYIRGRERRGYFYIVLFSFVCSMLFLVIRQSLFIIFLGWEGLGLTSFLLIIFYQNWNRWNGGLLTLLTNRLGDAILMLVFVYWIINNNILLSNFSRGGVLLLLFLLTMTKRAQVPFTRWLPAAMAAPTPVRALVHSSTLVTAGVWILIRFGQANASSLIFWFLVGLLTLLVARIAALVENDAKKVVALSTLRQLGLIYFSLCLGGAYITLFHLLIHAIAKANLFLIVGNSLHSRFSQQDTRLLSSGVESSLFFLIVFISVLRLRGVIFTSGFFSKDYILLTAYGSLTRVISFIIVLSIITITLAYCYKLYLSLLYNNNTYLTEGVFNILAFTPRFFLRGLRLFFGFFLSKNILLTKMFLFSKSGLYWVFLIGFVLVFSFRGNFFMGWFKAQLETVGYFSIKRLFFFKKLNFKFRRTFLEGVFNSRRGAQIKIVGLSPAIIIFLSITMVFFFIF